MEPYVELVLREQGRVVHRHRGQNIWVDAGKEWLRDLVHSISYNPLSQADNRRIRYMGFGIGGSRQTSVVAAVPPMSTDYPGTNIQLDVDPAVSTLERPVRVASGTFLHELSPPVFDVPNAARFTVVLDQGDLNYGAYTDVPISEVGLFLEGSNTALGTNPLVAYDTFPDIQKTNLFTLEVTWVVSF